MRHLTSGDEMKTEEILADYDKGAVEVLRSLDAECKSCAPVSALACISNCSVWRLRNELRALCGALENPDFVKDLFNVLKNGTRLSILQTISRSRSSTEKIQQELRKDSLVHSQETLLDEYLGPLLRVGLAVEAQGNFYATTFGSRILELVGNLPEFVKVLPAHSECYEEGLLKALLDGPKTFDEVSALIPSKIVSRLLKRLKTVGLIVTPEDRDYVFFFRSKRDLSKETLTATESTIYYNISDEGISAKKLAEKSNLSLRRTYKYVRGLKGKKLVFARKTPKTYSLTEQGERLAWLIRQIHHIVEETADFSEEYAKHNHQTR
jgi:predicted transcriptional regulator